MKRTKSKAVLTIRFAVLLSKDEYKKLLELSHTCNSSAGAVLRQLLNDAARLDCHSKNST